MPAYTTEQLVEHRRALLLDAGFVTRGELLAFNSSDTNIYVHVDMLRLNYGDYSHSWEWYENSYPRLAEIWASVPNTETLAEYRLRRFRECGWRIDNDDQVTHTPDGDTVNGGCINDRMLAESFDSPGWDWDERARAIFEEVPGTVAPKVKKPKAAPSTPDALIALASTTGAIDAINKGLIRCGFELEFQSLNGLQGDGNNELDTDAEPDYELLGDRAREAYDNADSTDLICSIRDKALRAIADAIYNSEFCSGFDDIHNHLTGTLATKMEEATDRVRDRWIESWESDELNNNPENYYPTRCGMYESLAATRKTRDVIDCGTDGSVRGGEIRTVGALTPQQFLSAATNLLNANHFEVDTGCSFHIHLSVPGVKHSYGASLQAEMTAYLLENMRRLPACVRKRLKSESGKRYAKLHLSKDKFTAVHFHAQGSWEFRLFGNIDSAVDARRCLLLAIEAIRHAYQVKLGKTKSLASALKESAFASTAQTAASSDQTFTSVAKSARRAEQQAA